MKKSGKLTVVYILTSIGLFLVLLGGGVYGIYVSVGLSFVRSSVPEFSELGGGAANVSFGGTANYSPSMTGIIILSAILVGLAIFDFINLIKQIVFFKQFKVVKNSKLEKKVESKVRSKGSVIFWTFLIDILSLAAGIAGLFINGRSFFEEGNYSWIFYAVDIAVSVLSLVSIILLIAKLKARKQEGKPYANKKTAVKHTSQNGETRKPEQRSVEPKEINQMEYNLIKLEALKRGKLITKDEYEKLRKKVLKFKKTGDISDNMY